MLDKFWLNAVMGMNRHFLSIQENRHGQESPTGGQKHRDCGKGENSPRDDVISIFGFIRSVGPHTAAVCPPFLGGLPTLPRRFSHPSSAVCPPLRIFHRVVTGTLPLDCFKQSKGSAQTTGAFTNPPFWGADGSCREKYDHMPEEEGEGF